MKKLLISLLLAASCHAAAVYEYTFSDQGGSGYGFGPSLLPSPVFIPLITAGVFQTQFGQYYDAEIHSLNGNIDVIAFGGDSVGPIFQDGVEFTVPADAVGTFFGTQFSALGANGPYLLTVTATPEPATLALLVLGGAALLRLRFKLHLANLALPNLPSRPHAHGVDRLAGL